MENDNAERIIIGHDEWALRLSFVKFSSFEVYFLEITFNFLIQPKYCAKTTKVSKNETTTKSEK